MSLASLVPLFVIFFVFQKRLIEGIAASGLKSVKLLQNGTIKTYPGYPHGMLTVHADVLNADLLAFIKA